MLDVSPFYSVILGFRGNTDSLPLFPWILEPMLCQPFWWPVIFLFFIVLFFWCCFPKSFLLTFHYGVSLEGWPPISLPSRLLILTLFRLSFLAVLLFVIFLGEPNLFLSGWRFSRLLLFIVLLSGLPEVLAPCSWIFILQAFWFLSASLDDWEGRICPLFFVFLGAFFELSQSQPSCVARPEDPELLAAFRYPGPILPTRLSLIFWSWQVGLFSFLSSISWALRPVLLWVLGFKFFLMDLGHPFLLWWAQPFYIGFTHCAILGLGVITF